MGRWCLNGGYKIVWGLVWLGLVLPTGSGGFVFGEWYSVRPGAYELRFEYDIRLMGDTRKDPWVPWSAVGCKLEILD